MPFFNMVYGTAWKEDRTAELVRNAIHAGFRAVDTAAETNHYREDLVGSALRKIYAENDIRRDEIYVSKSQQQVLANINTFLGTDQIHP